MKRAAALFLVVTMLALIIPTGHADASVCLSDGDREFCGGRAVGSVKLDFDSAVKAVYIRYSDECVGFEVDAGGEREHVDAEYLNYYLDQNAVGIDLRSCELLFCEKADILGVTVFLEDEDVPADVQIWQPSLDRADLMLCTTHADDEQLFFAGVLPYYAANGYDVQVVYFTDHQDNVSRRQELLAGLWEVGIRNYPVINVFPDKYSTSLETAVKHLKKAGFTYDDAVAFWVRMLRRFEPLVVVGHDINGEYGHGQHMLNTASLIDAVKICGDETQYEDSAEKYGVWEIKKLYLHLYEENKIVMDWDRPLEFFGGRTAFEMTQAGFSHHKSQHYTWFYKWIYGKSTPIKKATDIKKYSPCEYGLYLSNVGEDVNKNDFFENIDETHRQKAEREAREEEERKLREDLERKEEERRKAEEERIKLEEEQKRQEQERLRLEEDHKKREAAEREQRRKLIYVTVAIFAAAIIVTAVSVLVFIRKRK